MARLSYTQRALTDFERLADFLRETDPAAAATTPTLIADALALLRLHPHIGRPRGGPIRELVISRGATGYVALYSVEPGGDEVLVLALRHQREAGYGGDIQP